MIAACPENLEGRRDAALLAVGYDTLCRSSELAAMKIVDLASDYRIILVPQSKSDQYGEGRVGHLSPRTIKLVKKWVDAAGVHDGYLFRGLHTRRVGAGSLSTSSIRRIIKRSASRADLGPEVTHSLSGHSMRVGAAQDMMIVGIDAIGIMQAGGWRTYSVLARYVEKSNTQLLHEERWRRIAAKRTGHLSKLQPKSEFAIAEYT
jgi:integrase